MIYHANINQRKSGMTILIYKIDLRAKKITTDIEMYYGMIVCQSTKKT